MGTVSVSDSNGPVTRGQVDISDGGKTVLTLQLVSSSSAGFTPGTAALRKIFASGTHVLRASFRAASADLASSSSPVTLQVSSGAYATGPGLRYSQTVDFSVNGDFNLLDDVKTADFNNDGIPDLVVARFQPSGFGVAFGDPANPGHFLTPSVITLSAYIDVEHAIPVDFDADGLTDLLLVSNDNSSVYLYRNNPAHPGTFIAGATLSMPGYPQIAVADFNHDGLPDIVAIGRRPGSSTQDIVNAFYNTPASPGTFQQSASSFAIGFQDIHTIAAVDMDNDGLVDLVVTDYLDQSVLVLRNGAAPGPFAASYRYSVPFSPASVAIGDFNNDGLPDVAVAGLSSSFGVFLNTATQPGTLQPVTTFAAPGQTYMLAYAGDIDGDGNLDVVCGTTNNYLYLFEGQGNGTFLSPSALQTGPTAPAWENTSVLLADLDGDGLTDLVATELRQNTAQVFLHNLAPSSRIPTATDLSASASAIRQGQTLTLTATETAVSGLPVGSIDFLDSSGGVGFSSIGTSPLNGNMAVFTTSSLSLGFHDFVAIFHGDSAYAPSQSVIIPVVVTAGPSAPLHLGASPNPASSGQTVTITAALSPNGTAATGTITFYDGMQLLGSSPVSANAAGFSISTLAIGAHTLSAIYSGDNQYPSSVSNTVTEIIGAVPTVTSLGASPNPANYGAAVAFNVTVSSTNSTTPSGSVQLVDDNGTALATLTLDASGLASTTLSTLTPGSHVITAQYGGDNGHSASNSTPLAVKIVNAPSLTTLTATPQSAFAFQAVQLHAAVQSSATGTATPTGSVVFAQGQQSLASVPLNAAGAANAQAALPAGSYTLLANYSGDGVFTSSSAGLTETVAPDATFSTLRLSPNPGTQAQTIVASITVVPLHSNVHPDGNVAISEGATSLALGTLTSQGTLTAQITGLPAGTHHLVATYSGSSNFLSSVAAQVDLVILPLDYTLASDPPQIAIQAEHHASLQLTLKPVGGLQDQVQLTCANLPAHVFCIFSTTTVTINGGPSSSQLTLDTDDVRYFARAVPSDAPSPRLPAWPLLAGLVPLCLARRRRSYLNRIVLVFAMLVALPFSSGCGNKEPAHAAPGTYTVLVTAHASHTGIDHQQAIQLTVTP